MPTDWLDYEGDRSSSKSVAMLAEGVLERIGHSNIHRVHATAMSDQANVTIHYNGGDIEASVETDDEQALGEVVDALLRSGFEGEGGGDIDHREPHVEEDPRIGQVFKPFSHDQAGYVPKEMRGSVSRQDDRCSDCAHWDGRGNCHIVPDVEADAYCKKYYADVGFFADGVSSLPNEAGELEQPHVNLTLWGEKWNRLEGSSAGAIVESIKDKFVDKMGEINVQFIGD